MFNYSDNIQTANNPHVDRHNKSDVRLTKQILIFEYWILFLLKHYIQLVWELKKN